MKTIPNPWSNALSAAIPAEDEGHWLTVSDLMATLMMIFLFLAVLHMVQVERLHQAETEVRVTAAESRQAIYSALEREFRHDLPRWNAELVERTLTLRFREPDILFDRNSARIKPEFEAILNDFLPRYVAQLEPFRDVIREIRIEGHTSSEWKAGTPPLEAYFLNMELSQQRTQAVLRFAYGIDLIKGKDWFRERVAAVGLSSSRPVLDASGHEDTAASRRVEFSVLTNFESRLLEPIRLESDAWRR
ncbi:OmpA family protein [Thermochromatium tepidum]|uniref:OmpA family protein n=1 Tax=Thermochromatium tepidum ATCC 43061 TaxID=316276 RepID=A0A6I6EEM7_THETI|nr:OmpA family protein [Thermochromatium tepidum]QGU33736.1 OmpA family protein [Thermochromatium tepidum ATCC 43061]